MTKEEWRLWMKQRLASLSSEVYHRHRVEIEHRLYEEEWWQEAKTVGITVAIGREIETRNMIARGWQEGKQIAVPKSDPERGNLQFFVITSFDQLKSGHYGIPEPNPDKTRPIETNAIDLVIVPGLVFDQQGFRIGYGGGFYDRFLAEYSNKTLALAFEMQLVPEIPRDSFDMPVHRLITEKKTYRFV